MSAQKISKPMQIASEMLIEAIKKAGHNKKILSEELGISYNSVLSMYYFNKIPSENHLLKIEKFLNKKSYRPRETLLGRPKH